jgi:hypothetical protein
MNAPLIILVAGSFSGKSLIASYIANKYQFSGVLSTDMIRNFYNISTKNEQIFSTSTYKMPSSNLYKQKELVSKMIIEIIQIYQKRGEKMIIEGMHFSEHFLSFINNQNYLVIGLDNRISIERKIKYKRETTRNNIPNKTDEEKKRMNEIHKELIDYCRKYEFNIIEFTNIEEAKKQCDVLIEKYLLHFGEGLH